MTWEWNRRKQDHINKLARPKINHQVIQNRPTVYWTDKLPSAYHRFTAPVLSPRQEVLSQSKKLHPNFMQDRLSPEWVVTYAALTADPSPRVLDLAQPRSFADGWTFDRPSYPEVSKAAMTAVASARILNLAKPRSPPQRISSKSYRRPSQVGTLDFAKFDQLSKPRIYTFDSHDPYKVSKAALEYIPSPRILEISRPVRIRGKVVKLHP